MLNAQSTIVVTSISSPNDVLRALAKGCATTGARFILIGDAPSPKDFALEGCDYFDLDRQAETGFKTANLLPQRHYARKNIGYLLAARAGAEVIVETDDDNLPRDAFWAHRTRSQSVRVYEKAGWVNIYRYFTGEFIWPRGLPLDEARAECVPFEQLPLEALDCPIQQGLADGDPDVDAIYRLILAQPVSFRTDRRVGLARNVWCPFNSQNTTFWRDAFPLLYLPAFCSFRMTDIWRSFVAQRIAWENGWRILFHEPTVYQLRNQHNLMRDFQDEVPGYLHNRRIAETLEALSLLAGVENLGTNLLACYEELARVGVMEPRELPLVEAWLRDLSG